MQGSRIVWLVVILLPMAQPCSPQSIVESGGVHASAAGLGAGMAASAKHGRVISRSYESALEAQRAALAQTKAIEQYMTLGCQLETKKQWTNAEKSFKYALQIIARRDGPGSIKSVPALKHLVAISKAQNNLDQAINFQETVVLLSKSAKTRQPTSLPRTAVITQTASLPQTATTPQVTTTPRATIIPQETETPRALKPRLRAPEILQATEVPQDGEISSDRAILHEQLILSNLLLQKKDYANAAHVLQELSTMYDTNLALIEKQRQIARTTYATVLRELHRDSEARAIEASNKTNSILLSPPTNIEDQTSVAEKGALPDKVAPINPRDLQR